MKKRLIFLAMAPLLLLTACGRTVPDRAGIHEIHVYRLIRPEYRDGAGLLQAEKITYTDELSIIQGAAILLKSIPDDSTLECSLPTNINILSIEQIGKAVDVSMNDAYRKLSGLEKTIVDSCITLTMCSIPGVDFVYIRVRGDASYIRLSAEDIMLRDTVISADRAEIRLYFPKSGANQLALETRTISIREDISAGRIVIDELMKGPTKDGLLPSLPEGTVVLPVYIQDGVCSVSFSEDFLMEFEGDSDAIMLAVYSVVNSLTCLSGVDSVMIIIQGNESNKIGNIDISQPLTRRSTMIGSAVIE